jgi:hypothetical protein
MVTAPLSLALSDLSSGSLDVVLTPDFAALGLTPAQLSKEEIDLATHVASPSKERHELYELYRDYHEGRQRDPRGLRWNDQDRTQTRTFQSVHNVCGPLVDIPTERLTVASFRLTGPDGAGDDRSNDLAALLWRWWQASRMDALARIVHRHAFRYGDAYLMVEWDSLRDRPRYSLQDPLQIEPVYDGNGDLVAVYKAWEEHPIGEAGTITRTRINRYRPGLIEKFVSVNSLTYTYWTNDVDSDGRPDGGIIPWVDAAGTPLPIPIVHFRNQADGSDFGRSDLADAIPMQDAFNVRTWATGQAAIFDGARIKYGVNVAAFVDPTTGQQRDPPLGPNAWWYLKPDDPNIETVVGSIEPGDVAQLQEVADRELKTIAGLLGIPMHLIWPAGGLPSGESLKTAEARLVSKLLDRTITLGNGWEDAQYLAIRLANVFGAAGLPEDRMCTTQWKPVETRSELTDEQVIALKKDDLSWRQRMRERDYSEEDIDQIEQEKEDEREAAPVPVMPQESDNLPADGDQMTPQVDEDEEEDRRETVPA